MSVEYLVVIGASSGGFSAVSEVVRGLPAGLPAAVCVVVHISPESPGTLPLLLNRAGALPAAQVTGKQTLEQGRIYVAQPDHHLLIEPGSVRAARGPKEHRFRPAVDPLFRSAAQVYGPRVIGVVLSGHLDDGTSGLWAIKKLGGTAIVQDPRDAEFSSMPEHAARHVPVDYCLPLADIAPLLTRLTATTVHGRPVVTDDSVDPLDIEVRIAGGESARDAGLEALGPPSGFACPECHGVLLELREENRQRYRCHTGHAYSAASLRAALDEEIDRALWIGIRTFDEASRILKHMSIHGADADTDRAQLEQGAKDAEADRQVLRSVADRRGRTGMP
jgi:two-component system chemotaxis response regulator CheB